MNFRAAQSGMALMISLIMLLLLTIIAITAAQQSSLQARMAGNSQQQNIAFQTAESGIQAWISQFVESPLIQAQSKSGQLTDTTPFEVSAGTPSICANVMDSFSLDANENSSNFQYACFDIESNAKSCVDASCEDSDNPARARHFQGHLVRYQ